MLRFTWRRPPRAINSAYVGINAAMDDVRNGKTLAVPEHLRTPTRKKLAAAGGADAARLEYLYSHDYPEHYVPQAYLPEGRVYYTPTGNGLELRIDQGTHGIPPSTGGECRGRREEGVILP